VVCEKTKKRYEQAYRRKKMKKDLQKRPKQEIKKVSLRLPRVGWLRSVDPLKLQVSFAKEPYERDDVLQKRPKHGKRFMRASSESGVATMSRLLKITGLFFKRAL